MIETSAHLIDHVIPPVPTRQWVLSFPWPLRFLYASPPDVLSRTLVVITRAIETDLIHRAGLIRRTANQLERDGVLIQDTEQPYLDLTQADIQDSFNAASVRYRIAIGSNQGQKTLTLRSEAFIRTDTPSETALPTSSSSPWNFWLSWRLSYPDPELI